MINKLSVATNTGPLIATKDVYKQLAMLKEAGFDCYDFTMMQPIEGLDLFFDSDDYIARAKAFRKYADSLKMKCVQTHGRAAVISSGFSKEETEKRLHECIRCFEISEILGAKYCVVHPSADFTIEENAEYIKKLLPVSHKTGVIIAIENCPACEQKRLFGNPDDLITLIDLINDENVKACLDTGHASMIWGGSNPTDFVNKLRNKLVCLHIHDNNYHVDAHQLPYTSMIDFESFISALASNGYEGSITFEADSYIFNIPQPLKIDALKYLKNIGEYMAKEVVKRN